MQIPGFPGYELERTGQRTWQITSFKVHSGGRLLQGHTWADGRVFYNLMPEPDSVWRQNGRNGVNRQLAFYVLLAVSGPPPSLRLIAAHLDQDPSNNDPSNLHWVSPAVNTIERNALPVRKACRRGHDAVKLRYHRPSGAPSNCQACQMASRLQLVDIPVSMWPQMLQPGHEDELLEWMASPRSKREPMGLMPITTPGG